MQTFNRSRPAPVKHHTCIGHRGILVEGHQGWIQQDNVGVLGDHPVVRCLDPWLVLVHCGAERKDGENLVFC